jgi:hypothetical protein
VEPLLAEWLPPDVFTEVEPPEASRLCRPPVAVVAAASAVVIGAIVGIDDRPIVALPRWRFRPLVAVAVLSCDALVDRVG